MNPPQVYMCSPSCVFSLPSIINLSSVSSQTSENVPVGSDLLLWEVLS